MTALIDIYNFILFTLSLIVSLGIINICIEQLQSSPKCLRQSFRVYFYRIIFWVISISGAHSFFMTLTTLNAELPMLLKDTLLLVLLLVLYKSKMSKVIKDYIQAGALKTGVTNK